MLAGRDQNISKTGFTKLEGYSDPDDYVDIESGEETYCCYLYRTGFSLHWLAATVVYNKHSEFYQPPN